MLELLKLIAEKGHDPEFIKRMKLVAESWCLVCHERMPGEHEHAR